MNSMKTKAHVSETKKKEVKRLGDLIRKYSVIGIIDMENMPTKQLQNMRALIRGKVELIVSKKRLMRIAIENCKEDKKGIEQLEEFLVGMPSVMFTNEDPFKLARLLNKNKSPAPAKQGQKAPKDLIVKAGPTSFSPGPIIGELGALGIKSGVESGKVVVKEDCVVCKEGDVISGPLAAMLVRLGIEPMEIGLNLLGVYENGLVYKKDVLSIDEEQVQNDINTAAVNAFNLAFNIGYVTKDNAGLFIKKAFAESKALVEACGFMTDEKIKEYLNKAEAQALGLKEKLNIPDTDEKVDKMVEQTKGFAGGKTKAEELVEEAPEEKESEQKEEKVLEEEKEIIKEEQKLEKKEEKIEAPVEKEVREDVKEEEEKKLEKERIEKEKEFEKVEETKDKEKTDDRVKDMVKKTEDFAKGDVVDAENLIEEAGKKAVKDDGEKKRKKIEEIAQKILKGEKV